MAARIRAFDWSKTPLGPMEGWPQSLRTAVSICLGSRLPMMLWWGQDLINIYNDAFISVLGGWHPRALGMSGRDVWTDTWPVIGPQVKQVMEEGGSTLNERVGLVYTRHGFPEETWFTWSFGPIYDESGKVAGLFNTCHEDTQQVLAERERDRLAAEQKRLLAALDNERSRLAEVIGRSPAFICTLQGPDHIFEIANERYYEIAGRRDIIGKAVRDVQPEVEEQGYLEILDRVYRTGKPFEAKEKSLLLRRGDDQSLQQRFINVAWQPLREADGRVSGVFIHGVDVTDLVQSRESLRVSEERYRRLVETAHEGVWIIDGAGRTTYINQRMADLLGYAPEEISGRVHTDFMWEQDRPKGDVDMERRREGTAEVWDQRYRRKDSSELWTVASCNTLYDADGKFAGALGMFTDITDRKRAEESLRESEQRFRLMADAVPQIVWITDAEGRVEFFNQQWSKYTGIDYVLATADDVAATVIHPDDRPATKAAFDAALRSDETFFVEHRIRSAAGEYRWFLVRGEPHRDPQTGQVTRWFGASVDIHDRRRAEEALQESEELVRTIAENSTQGLAMMDERGYCTYANRAWLDMTRYSAEEIGSKPLHDLVHHHRPDGRPYPKDECPIDRALPENFDVRAHEDLFFRKDGSTFPVLVAASPIFEDGRPVSTVIEIRDVTEAKRAETERERLLEAERAARSEAERASRMKDEFLATLSHELRTPLNAILGWSQILARGTKDAEDLAEGLRVIERNARTQAQIIEDLLDMSRIISGKVRLDVQRVDLAAIVNQAVSTAKPSADAKGIRLQTVLDSHAGPVSGDPSRLQQVMWNLLSNAVKFTPRGGRVQVLLERVESHFEVSVSDTGEGIAPEFLPHVFDRFRQADATTTRRHGGLGLGLSIVKQLVELHGGSIRVQSAGVGHGTTFSVSLPLSAIQPAPDPDVERHHPRLYASTTVPLDACAQIAGVKILVVDDEADARALVRRLLEDCKAQVVTAGSAAEALELVRTEKPDVLVCDIGMAGEDGYSLIRRIRALGPEHGGQVPSAALTAYARAEDRVKAIVAGFQMHLAKPVEPAELIATVAGLAGRTGR